MLEEEEVVVLTPLQPHHPEIERVTPRLPPKAMEIGNVLNVTISTGNGDRSVTSVMLLLLQVLLSTTTLSTTLSAKNTVVGLSIQTKEAHISLLKTISAITHQRAAITSTTAQAT